ncbi:hypothetical protein HYH03_009619 [Edaphochlamys debaryana]|uniref:RING-type domain-containing protein n=1 Tax=Edaphochlamys debaryana TaxID=47281 RepID=A0A835Y000_9CHLO|nr:hypothetical protein HYH03_009619 [Edaphochlamys debaryana]|eukprot:KAG2492128.1 hypothetical protein HYH03_009619 [Edaphochlamys debaryana]
MANPKNWEEWEEEAERQFWRILPTVLSVIKACQIVTQWGALSWRSRVQSFLVLVLLELSQNVDLQATRFGIACIAAYLLFKYRRFVWRLLRGALRGAGLVFIPSRYLLTYALRAALAAAAAIQSWRAEAAARAATQAATRPATPPTTTPAASTSSRGGTSKVERRTTASGRGAAAAPGRQAPPDAGPSRGAQAAPSGKAGGAALQSRSSVTKPERRVAAWRGAGGASATGAAAETAAAATEASAARAPAAATQTVTPGRPNAAPPSPLTRQEQAAPAASQALALPTAQPVPYNPFAAARSAPIVSAPPPNGLAGALPPGLPAGAPSVPAPTAVVSPSATTDVTPRRPGVPSWGGTDSKPVPGPSHEEDEDHSVMCVMCLDGPRRFGFLHGTAVHTGVCEECSAVLRSRMPGLECLLCRQPVEEIVMLF